MESFRLQSGYPGTIVPAREMKNRANPSRVAASQRPSRNLPGGFLSRNPLEYFWSGGGSKMAVGDGAVVEVVMAAEEEVVDGKSGRWMESVLEAGRAPEVVENGGEEVEDCSSCCCGDYSEDEDDKNEAREDEEKIEFDSNSFSRFLRRVNLSDAKMFAQLSYLSMLAYCIPKIKAKKLVNNRGLSYVTSSLEKKEMLTIAEKDRADQTAETQVQEKVEDNEHSSIGHFIDASAAYDIAASAAAYLHSHTKSILPFSSPGDEDIESGNVDDDEVAKASVKATADSVTSVISSEDEVKQSVADDLNSIVSSPCEWFICDDHRTATRYFVIQGSESLASWQANLLFEPVQFEGLDVLVHRGIYEAAKGIYEQMLPEIHSHLNSHGERATLRFTGHSLGGSLAMLVNLMLLIRQEVAESCLLPVVTFGAPFIMCGGNKLLTKLGLPENHVQALIFHRDVVPRAFSAELPSHAVDLLKAVNSNFRNHPCLSKKNIMYAPMGQLLILQPDPRFSPPHILLPPGSGLYLLTPPSDKPGATKKSLRSAQLLFLNTPHPLEILSDRAAYGTEGTISRDHDMRSYLKAIRVVIRHELNQVKKARTEQRNKDHWPLVSPRGRTTMDQPTSATNILQQHELVNFSGSLNSKNQSWKRFSRLVASQHVQMFLLLLVPARLLLLDAFNALRFS
ncbi:unnamed protein product [Rhodiola kirilowii]